jgi:soluble lytic murein transglycosylase-like protein
MGWRIKICAGALLGLSGLAVQAQVWGFVDQRGVSHFATERLDDRYELFYAGPGTDTSGAVSGAVTAPPALLASFEVSTAYKAVRHHMREAARANGIEYELLKAVVAKESGFDSRAVSPKGAVGLMQLMPETAQRFGVRANADGSLEEKLTDPRTNLQAGARYLAWLMKKFDGQVHLVLAAYNAGEGAVLKYGRQVPPYRETLNYVRAVTELRQLLQPPRATRQPQARLVGQVHRTASL